MANLRRAFSAALLVFATLGCSPRFDARGQPSDAGKTVAEWLAMSAAGTDPERATAVSALAEIAKQDRNSDQRVIPAIVRALDDKAPHVRFVAAIAVSIVGPDGSAAGDRLLELLEDKDAAVRRAAVESIPRVGVPSNLAVPPLTKMLDDDNHIVRVRAAQSLARYGPDAKKAISRMEAMALDEESSEGRNLVADALRKIRDTGSK